MEPTKISTNTLAFIGLCNEYCSLAENVSAMERHEFIDRAVKLLPRLYISATDLANDSSFSNEDGYIEPSLNEEYYEQIRSSVAMVMGEDDIYLEVFEQDMKYSDTPIAASISEGVADLFQVCYNFVEVIRDAPEELIAETAGAMHYDFRHYWSQTLCNLMRPLNQLCHNSTEEY
ncbi:MAG: DUF5063 domain-containing protein [Muribaculaceae bacterium]|nr:DUF5063 domain-containing protein [Muribaculaceae bacterium]